MTSKKGTQKDAKNEIKKTGGLTGPQEHQEIGSGGNPNQAAIVEPGGQQGPTNGNGKMPEKHITVAVGEMLFYSRVGIDTPFESESEDTRKRYIAEGRELLIVLDKLNLMIVPKRNLTAERLSDITGIAGTIRAFMSNMQSPKDLQNTFPIDELAVRIVDERRV